MAAEPSFNRLEDERRSGTCRGSSFATGVHPNRYHYKYFFWVFWRESPVDGPAFLSTEHRMSFASAMELIQQLRNQGEVYWIYNTKIPRLDPAHSPFNPQAARWADTEWALPYDQDTDPEWDGFK